jgi:hypothetical protein
VNAEASCDKIRAGGDRLRSTEGDRVLGDAQRQNPLTLDRGQHPVDLIVTVFIEMSVGVDQHGLLILIASNQARATSPERGQRAPRSPDSL